MFVMEIPKDVIELANRHGFNDVGLAKHTSTENVYSVGCVDDAGVSLPTGLPHYIFEREGALSLVCDEDLHITDAL